MNREWDDGHAMIVRVMRANRERLVCIEVVSENGDCGFANVTTQQAREIAAALIAAADEEMRT